MINLIYFGEKYYTKSGKMLSSFYDKDGKSYDWEFVKNSLDKEKNVNIRAATIDELENM